MTDGILFQAFVYLMAAVIAVPLAKRFGLGSVLGYLLAGVLIGPHAFDLVGHEGEVRHFAEFGVVMMLFLIGLELQPAVLWKLRVPILGLGGLQVAGTAALAAPLAMLAGLSWKAALAAGLIVAMSSTAIVLTTLQEKGWSRNAGGQSAFAVLLFQDIAVIPILAVMPLLAATGATGAAHGAAADSGHGAAGVAALPPWAQALSVLAAVAVVIGAGRFLSRPVFRFIAGSRLREVFTAAALLLVVGIALLMQRVGLSPALGAFLAGVVLADNEYRHELEGDIEPFKGLLLGLFFITVGAGVDLPYIAGEPARVAGLVFALMSLKAGFLFALAKAFRIGTRDAVLLALALCQVGEFAFVLLSLSQSLHVLAGEQAKLLVAATALSMALTPPLFILLDRVLLPRLTGVKASREQDRVEDEGAPVLIAGFGRMGNLIGRLLRANGIKTTVLELNPDVVDSVRKLGLEAYYGDASRLDLLHAAGAGKARLLILALDNPEKTLEIVETARKHFPHLHILARASGREDAYVLVNHGLPHVFRETFGTALAMGYRALRQLGMRGMQAHRAVRAFEGHNEKAFRELARLAGDDKAYVSAMRAKIGEAEDLLKDGRLPGQHLDLAWDNAPLREAARDGILKR